MAQQFISSLNGSVFDHPVTVFHVIPYFAQKSLPLPDLDKFINILTDRLRIMEDSTTSSPDNEDAEGTADNDGGGSDDESTLTNDDNAN